MNLNSFYSDNPVFNKCANCLNITSSIKLENSKYFYKAPHLCKKCSIKEQKEIDSFAKNERHGTYRSLALTAGMPTRFIGVSKIDFNEKKLELLKLIISTIKKDVLTKNKKSNTNYLIHGAPDKGKSHAGAYIFCNLIYDLYNMSENKFKWVSFSEILLQLQKFDESSFSVLNTNCFFPDILVLEFGDTQSENVKAGGEISYYSQNIFQSIIDYRWKRRKSTIYITALGCYKPLHVELIKRFDEATVGRMFEDCQIIKWGTNKPGNINYRMKKQKSRTIWEI